MTRDEAAAALDRSEYREEGSPRLFEAMKASGLVAVFGLCLIFLLSDPTEASSPAIPILGYSLGLLLLAAGWLMFSKRIQYLTTPPGSGG